MELNIEKIDAELNRIGKKRLWLAYKCGVDHQLVYYWLKSKSLKGAEPIAKALGYLDPKDLVE